MFYFDIATEHPTLGTTRNPDIFGGQKPPKISDYRRKQVIFGGF